MKIEENLEYLGYFKKIIKNKGFSQFFGVFIE